MLREAIAAGLPHLQAEAEGQMQDTFTAYAPAGKVKDADGMKWATYNAAGTTQGKIQSRSRQGDTNVRTETVGGVARPVIEGGLHIPVDSPAPTAGPLGVGWEYVLTTPGPFTPPELAGSRWLVVDSPAKSYMTSRRLDVVRLP